MQGIASTKKHDKLLGARSTGGVQDIIVGVANPVNVLWSPTTRLFNTVENGPSHRNSTTIYFKGINERVYLELGDTPMVWRRVVFWSYARYEWAQSILDGGNYYRRFEPFGYSEQPDFFETILRGTIALDWTQGRIYDAAMDPITTRVISDRKMTVNPRNDTGFLKNRKLWYNIGRKFIYNDEEAGSGLVPGIWSAIAPGLPGNLYIWDHFYIPSGPAAGEGLANVHMESTVYWHES